MVLSNTSADRDNWIASWEDGSLQTAQSSSNIHSADILCAKPSTCHQAMLCCCTWHRRLMYFSILLGESNMFTSFRDCFACLQYVGA